MERLEYWVCRDYVHLFSEEKESGAQRNPKSLLIARVKSVLLVVAVTLAILSLVVSLSFWFNKPTHKVDLVKNCELVNNLIKSFETKLLKTKRFLEAKLSETKPFSDGFISLFLEKTQQALKHRTNDTIGQMIWHKLTGQCIDGSKVGTDKSLLDLRYHIYKSNNCQRTRTQQWRMIDGKLMVGYSESYPKITADSEPCLKCADGVKSCDLIVDACLMNLTSFKDTAAQAFFLSIKVNQIDVSWKRVYFTIHSQLHPTECAGFYHSNLERYADILHMENCAGTDNQLFYLSGVNYEDEFEEMYRQLSGS